MTGSICISPLCAQRPEKLPSIGLRVPTSGADGPNAAALSLWGFAVEHNDQAAFIAATGVPLLNDSTWGKADLDLAGRATGYSTSGYNQTWKVKIILLAAY